MKFKTMVVAAAALCASSAFAGISQEAGNAELFGVVWDEAFGTYAIDFGITVDQFNAGFSGVLGTVAGANWNAFVAADVNGLNDFSLFGGTRWAIFAVSDVLGYPGEPGAQNYFTTTTFDRGVDLDDISFAQAIGSMGGVGFSGLLNFNGLGVDPALNGDTFAVLGTEAHFIEDNYMGASGLFAGNAIGSSQTLFECTYGGFFDGTARSTCTTNPLTSVSFDGTAFSVTAVPEPGTYALMLAGLVAVGGIARRRRA